VPLPITASAITFFVRDSSWPSGYGLVSLFDQPNKSVFFLICAVVPRPAACSPKSTKLPSSDSLERNTTDVLFTRFSTSGGTIPHLGGAFDDFPLSSGIFFPLSAASEYVLPPTN